MILAAALKGTRDLRSTSRSDCASAPCWPRTASRFAIIGENLESLPGWLVSHHEWPLGRRWAAGNDVAAPWPSA
jgi:hypothetical protein